MIVYDGLKTDFLSSCERDSIAIEIEEIILKKLGRHTPKAEFRSWENSLNYMYKVLNDDEIPGDAGVAIEFNIPQTSKRVDFMISGYGGENEPGMVIVELKQWDSITEVQGADALVETYVGGGRHKVVHPSYQAWSYAQLIRDYNETVQDRRIRIAPCACLHNYIRHENDALDAAQYKEYLDEAPAFSKGQLLMLRDFIKTSVKKGDRKEVLFQVDHGKIRPSKSLQNAIGSMLKGNREFIMIDEQKVAYEEILRLSLECQKDYRKRTIIVRGGPGTGKTVIAVNLLAELTMRDQLVQYVSKNSAPRQVYLKKLMDSIAFLKSSSAAAEGAALAYKTLPTESARMAIAIIVAGLFIGASIIAPYGGDYGVFGVPFCSFFGFAGAFVLSVWVIIDIWRYG